MSPKKFCASTVRVALYLLRDDKVIHCFFPLLITYLRSLRTMKSGEAKGEGWPTEQALSMCTGLRSFSINNVQCTPSFPVSITWHTESQLRWPFHHDRTCEQEETVESICANPPESAIQECTLRGLAGHLSQEHTLTLTFFLFFLFFFLALFGGRFGLSCGLSRTGRSRG